MISIDNRNLLKKINHIDNLKIQWVRLKNAKQIKAKNEYLRNCLRVLKEVDGERFMT